MPIRFRCPHCQQRLSIGSHKSGSMIECPTCKERIAVPDDSEVLSVKGPSTAIAPNGIGPSIALETPTDSMQEPASQPVPFATAAQQRAPAISPPETEPRLASRRHLDAGRVSVPRSVIYAQGLLLGIVAAACLTIGIFLGWSMSPTTSPINPELLPCIVRGKVEYEDSRGNRLPDMGAVILALPEGKQPESKIPIAGFGVDDSPPKADHPGLRELENLGGKLARVDPAGNYELRVPRGGHFYIVAISKQARRGEAPHQSAITTVIGRFFASATKLLGEQRYEMEAPVLREERHLDFLFSKAKPEQ